MSRKNLLRTGIIISALLLGVGLLWAFLGGNPVARLLRQDRTWQAMQARGAWRVGMDPSFPPFELLDETGKPAGYDVDLAQQIAATWGLTVTIVPIGFDSLLDALQAGKIDSVISALPYDPRLTKDIGYSDPYFEAGIRLVTTAGSPLTSVEELAGLTVAVEWGSTGDMIGRRLQREQGIELALASFESPEEAIRALVEGSAAALFIDNITLLEARAAGLELQAIGPALEGNPYVIATPIGAYELQNALENALKTLEERGAFVELTQRWFGDRAAGADNK